MTPRPYPPLAAAVFAAVMLGAVSAKAAAEQADAPTATAPAETSVADQIAAYLADSPVARLPADDRPAGVVGGLRDRRPHGVVEVAVGSHGYRSVYVRSDLPIGETGTLSIAVGESRGGRGFYGPYGSYGPGDLRGPGCRSRVAVETEGSCLGGARVMAPFEDSDGVRPSDPAR